jgi:class 3 adenylate cyclase
VSILFGQQLQAVAVTHRGNGSTASAAGSHPEPDDIAGVGVHIGARVSGAASAGEVLVCSTVRDLVAGSGIQFEDRDEHEPRGVPGSWRLNLAAM